MRCCTQALCSLLFLLVTVAPSLASPPNRTNHFRFRMPREAAYFIEDGEPGKQSAGPHKAEWLEARPESGSGDSVFFGSRLVLQLKSSADLNRLTAGYDLKWSRSVASNIFLLQAPDAWTAVREAHRLALLPEVLASYPVVKPSVELHGPYAAQPNDQYFWDQWYLEHRNADGSSAGVDVNARAAWPFSLGEGVMIAVADGGVELTHPELANRAAGSPHFNFATQIADGTPALGNAFWAHGTECAGLALAEANNSIGMAGVAPKARLASWVIFGTNSDPDLLPVVSDEQLMEMYQYQSNVVSVQNHSWGHSGLTQQGPTLLEQIGLSNAFTMGRAGLGTIMVRSGGNNRANGGNADDDGYLSDPRVIVAGAVRIDGRAASFSSPGGCLLVAAPSGDPVFNTNDLGLFTTDLLGTNGANFYNFFPPNQDLNDYVFDNYGGFVGTSAAAPQVAGIAALILAANTNLTSRDVQQILLLSSRHFDFADPDLVTNGAGFRVSHNVGFGVPDAGAAVNLALRWTNCPPQTMITFTAGNLAAIPDDGLRVLITGTNVPANLASLDTAPGTGPHADAPTASLPLVDVGQATNAITINLTNKGALIQRGPVPFAEAITRAAQAGAAFAVVYNNATGFGACGGGDMLCAMGATDFVPIPAVFIGETDGENLAGFIRTNQSVLAQIHLASTNYVFNVTNTLICEQVGVRLQTDHPRRGDVRVTLVSPMGTRSVLQAYNADLSPGPVDWTYYSTHHFFESSAGNWTLYVSDEAAGATGTVLSASLIIYGVPIKDTDHDGLDDDWEIAHFGTLAYGPKDDPNHDGYNNAFEQILGTDPLAAIPLFVDISLWNQSLARLSWPGSQDYLYQVWGGASSSALTLLTNLPGRFPETEWFAPFATSTNQFFQVRALPHY